MGLLRLILAISFVAVIVGCADPHLRSTDPEAQQSDWPGAVISTEDVPASDPALSAAAASIRRVTYVSKSGVTDAYTHVTASIYVPRGAPPPGGFPVIAHGRGGCPAPDCAFTSRTADAAATIDGFLKAGYVVTVPDYQGLGNPSDGQKSYHPYLDSASAGYNLIDSVRATRKLLPETSDIWFAVGEAQGGQAAWAVNELSDDYGHPTLRGTISVSPTADLDGLGSRAMSGTLTPDQLRMYVGYLATLAKEYDGKFCQDDYRRGPVKDNWNLLLNCNPNEDAARDAVIAQINPDDLRPATPQALSLLARLSAQDHASAGAVAKLPMLVVFGDDDPLHGLRAGRARPFMPARWAMRSRSANDLRPPSLTRCSSSGWPPAPSMARCPTTAPRSSPNIHCRRPRHRNPRSPPRPPRRRHRRRRRHPLPLTRGHVWPGPPTCR